MLEIAPTGSRSSSRRLRCGTYSLEEARAEGEAMRAVEMHGNAQRLERLARLTPSQRDEMRRGVLALVPDELVPDVHEEFALAEEMAARVTPRVVPRGRPSNRERRAHASVAASVTPVEGKADALPARLARAEQDVNLGVLITAVLDEHARLVASRMRAELERIAISTPKVFTTSKLGPHIPGKKRRWMLEHVKSMPGARKEGRDWTISALDYDAWATAEDARRCKLAAQKKPSVVAVPALAKARNEVSHNEEDDAELQRRAESSLRAQSLRRSR